MDQQNRPYHFSPFSQQDPMIGASSNMDYISFRPKQELQSPPGGYPMENQDSHGSSSTYQSFGPFSPAAAPSTPLSEIEELQDPQHWITKQTCGDGNYSHQDSPYGAPNWTPSTLGWSPNSVLLECYDCIVVKGNPPYLKLKDGYRIIPTTPQYVFFDEPSEREKDRHPCMYPSSCTQKGEPSIFARPADLERHYIHIHSNPTEKYPCDRTNCERGRRPFTRKDHLRDHLKEYHKEDLGEAKRPKNRKAMTDKQWRQAQVVWKSERVVSSVWWRCGKCLKRVDILKEGWQCSTCNVQCEYERIEARRRLQTEVPSTLDQICEMCNGSAWIPNTNIESGWENCPNCQQATPALYGDTGDSWNRYYEQTEVNHGNY